MNVLILGAKGNMGRRYTAILTQLAHTVTEVDVPYSENFLDSAVKLHDHIVIATPTNTHHAVLIKVLGYAHPKTHILCEKPITKSHSQLHDIYQYAYKRKCWVWCVNQYAHLDEYSRFVDSIGESSYNYFKTGDDGMYWDCFQLFALARGSVRVSNTSPVWSCLINGVRINPANMDKAYVYMMEDFLGPKAKLWGEKMVEDATERILRRAQ